MTDNFSTLPIRELYDLNGDELLELTDEQKEALKDDMLKRIKRKRRARKEPPNV